VFCALHQTLYCFQFLNIDDCKEGIHQQRLHSMAEWVGAPCKMSSSLLSSLTLKLLNPFGCVDRPHPHNLFFSVYLQFASLRVFHFLFVSLILLVAH
jgi:hypothetical protein